MSGSGRGWRLLLASVAGGVLLALPFHAGLLEPLVLVAPIPWLLVVDAAPRGAFVRGLVGGAAFVSVGLWWMHHVHPAANLLTSAYHGLYIGAAFWAMARLRHGLRAPLWIAGPAAFVALEVFVEDVSLFRTTWLHLGTAAWRAPVLAQAAELVGVPGLTAVIVLVAAALIEAGRAVRALGPRGLGRARAPLLAAAVAVAAVAAWGAFRLATIELAPGPTVALVQGNVAQSVKNRPDNEDAIVEHHVALTLPLRGRGADLIAWPESTSMHFVEQDDELRDVLARTALTARTWLLVGAIGTNEPPAPPSNSVFLFSPRAELVGRADKRVLVPGAETLPVLRRWPAVRDRLADHLSRTMHFRPHLTEGREAVVLHAGEWAVGPLICYGDVPPWPADELKAAGAEILLVASNEAWFGRSELRQHAAIAAFRSVETRLPMARVTNDGMTCTFDPLGRLREALPRETEAVLVDTLPITDAWTVPPWVRRGLGWLVTLATLVAAAAGLARERRAGRSLARAKAAESPAGGGQRA